MTRNTNSQNNVLCCTNSITVASSYCYYHQSQIEVQIFLCNSNLNLCDCQLLSLSHDFALNFCFLKMSILCYLPSQGRNQSLMSSLAYVSGLVLDRHFFSDLFLQGENDFQIIKEENKTKHRLNIEKCDFLHKYSPDLVAKVRSRWTCCQQSTWFFPLHHLPPSWELHIMLPQK